MKISIKLFLTLVGLTAFILTTTLLLNRWTFEQGFRAFYIGLEKQRLESKAEDLSEAYTEAGNSWQTPDKRYLDFILQGDRRRPPGRPPRGEGFRPPQGSDPFTEANILRTRRPPPTALYNSNGELIAGLPNEETEYQLIVPILIGEEQIGELRSQPRPLVNWELANTFSRFQTRTSFVIALAGIILSAFISLFLTKHLLKPINAVRNKVSLLRLGTYDSTFTLSRKDELGELMEDIAALSKTLDQTRSTNKRWIADISHELRTPITILSGEIEILQAGYRPLDKQALYSIEQEVNRLSHIVDDLYQLSLADIGGLKYSFNIEDITDHVRCAIDACESAASEKGIAITFLRNESASAKIDPRRIEQLFLNIINNSISYTDTPGKLHVSLRKEKQSIIIEFEDTAPSISVQNCEEIFQPLFREDESRARRGSGAGLGLSICRSIVEAHDGNISALPSSLGGLKIRITLPAAE